MLLVSRMAASVLSLLLIGFNVEASPCANVQQGTYLSNVCWLTEQLSPHYSAGFASLSKGEEAAVTSVNESSCTVTYQEQGEMSGTTTSTIFFPKSDGRLLVYPEPVYGWSKARGQFIQIDVTDNICWELQGEGILGVHIEGMRYEGEIGPAPDRWDFGHAEYERALREYEAKRERCDKATLEPKEEDESCRGWSRYDKPDAGHFGKAEYRRAYERWQSGEGRTMVPYSKTSSKDEVSFCGPVLEDSVKNAVRNLYTNFCTYRKSEF